MKKYIVLSLLLFPLFFLNNTHAYTVDWIVSSSAWNYVNVTPESTYGDGSAVPNPPSSTNIVLMEGWTDADWPPLDSSQSVHTNVEYRQRFTFTSEFGNTDPVDVILSATNFGTIKGELTSLPCEDCSGDVRGGINITSYLQKVASGLPVVGSLNGGELYFGMNFVDEFSNNQETTITLVPGTDYYFVASVDIWSNITGGFGSQGWVDNGSETDPSGVSFLFDLPQETAVPIPGAVWLLGSGLIGIVGIRRKFRK